MHNEEFSDMMRLGQLRQEEEEYQQALEDLRQVEEQPRQHGTLLGITEGEAQERIKEGWDRRTAHYKQLAYQAHKDLFETRIAMEETEIAFITFVKELKALILNVNEVCRCEPYDDCGCVYDCIDTMEAALDIVLEGCDG